MGTASVSAAANAAASSFAALLAKLEYLSAAEIAQVRQAYRCADEAHLGQLRNSGEPYITHPIAVAAQCADWKLDAPALMAALLHDVLEDSRITKSELVERFGAPVAELVDGLTKLDKLQFDTREEGQAESFRKMLLAMARDVRVMLIKLADRTHNMRTLGDTPREKWARISRETLDIHAPIAHRLGLNQTYRELQELAFKHLRPWRHATLSKALERARSRRRDLIQKVREEVQAAFDAAGMVVHISGREKSLYSIYKKMGRKHLNFAQVNDMYGFRVTTPSASDCYTALGVLHQLYKPVPGRFKDFIAIPKANGYQSLHTSLVGPAGIQVEFQLRTQSMHVVAESGIAAHWLYKAHGAGAEPGDLSAGDRLGTQWLQSLLDIQQDTRDAAEFWDHVKVDLFPESVYVFTPKSQIRALPRGATVVDFAYAIHSNVGDHCIAATVNGQQAPLRAELKSGDVVEVVTSPAATPNPAWLDFVRTGRARSKIRHHLKSLQQQESPKLGERLLSQALRAEGMDRLPGDDAADQAVWDKLLRFTGNRTRAELMTDLGLGKRIASIVAKRLVNLLIEQGQKPDALLMTRSRFAALEGAGAATVALDGSDHSSIKYATCCRPVPGDPILGYLGRGEGLQAHRAGCAVAQKLLNKDRERFIEVEWSDEPTRPFESEIIVKVANGKGVLAKVATALATVEVDINHIDMGQEGAQDVTELRFVVSVRDLPHLNQAQRALARTPSVLAVRRGGHLVAEPE